MDPALGPPEKMVEREAELTPMMSQYYELCRAYDDCLVLFQVGDFYEAFCGAAETVSRLLEVALTQREDSTGTYAMAGIPIDNAESYVETLLDAGYRVAIADQVQDPEEVTGVVDRAVTRIITPGTLTEDELLADDANNFVACVTRADGAYGLALLDVSTGEFVATSADDLDTIGDEIGRFAPAEAITTLDDPDLFGPDCMISPHDPETFDPERAHDRVAAYFGDPQAMLAGSAEIRACGALLAYAEYTRGGVEASERDDDTPTLEYINHLTRYDPREYVLLDAVATRSLELFERRSVRGDDEATLAGVVDETVTALGSRRLTEWLRRPLLDAARIERRHDAVEELVGAVRVREEIREELRAVYDIERLVSRIARGRADARDLRSLLTTLDAVPGIREALSDVDCDPLRELHGALDPVPDVRALIDDAISEDPPSEITEGGVIKRGYDERLDDLRATERDGKQWVDELEETERERTGIDSLKVGHNSVHGYYIEVTDPNLDRVPEEYQRRQTLKNSERFVTPELKARETEIVRAEGRADDLEYELFREVRSEVAGESKRLQALADALARLDALAGLAEVAATNGYTRPDIVDERCVDIDSGRHPIVERRQERFVPNDTRLDEDRRLAVITGPNMSGKSTYMRQVALIVLLAQAGSFVPADAARIGPIDRIFTRVGASDDIAGGRSTFMIEMLELAEILRSADERSLVLLDEVGRGTSTADGLALARAIAEQVHDDLGAITLFATHHHELTETAAQLPDAHNLHFGAEHDGDDVVFSHEIAPGAATASYGVEVASEAGVPDAVVDRARELLTDDTARRDAGSSSETDNKPVAVDSGGEAAAIELLRETDVATLTPLEALNRLAELREHVE